MECARKLHDRLLLRAHCALQVMQLLPAAAAHNAPSDRRVRRPYLWSCLSTSCSTCQAATLKRTIPYPLPLSARTHVSRVITRRQPDSPRNLIISPNLRTYSSADVGVTGSAPATRARWPNPSRHMSVWRVSRTVLDLP